MGTVFGGLMARAFWTLGIPLNPLSPSQTSLAMARSRCSAREIKRFRETPVHAAVEGFLRAAAETHGPAEGPEPAVDVVVDTPAKIHRSKGVRCLCSTLNPPAGSLAEVGGCEAVCSLTPAQHFVVRARDLDPVGCCLLAMELCGTYLLRPDLPAGFATLPEPLVSVVDLAHQTVRNRGMPGARRALEALTHTCDGSASPMETAVVLLLVLPPELGGHGLPLPRLNEEVPISSASSRLLGGTRTVRPDILWPDAGLDLEYDSRSFHTQHDADRDRARRSALQTAGIEPLSLTTQIVGNAAAFDEVARLVARRLSMAAETPDPQAQAQLRQRLLGTHPVW